MTVLHKLSYLFGFLMVCAAAEAKKPQILVALPPHATLVTVVAGDRVDSSAVLGSGGDHEFFAPSPSALGRYRAADLYWISGLGFERSFLPQLQALAPRLRFAGEGALEAAAGESSADHAHDHDHHHHGESDPHWWLSPAETARRAQTLAAALAELDPPHAAEYTARAAAFAERCAGLEAELKAMLQPYRGRSFFVYHAAFGHFAEAFGLEQVALEEAGREPSLRAMGALIARGRAEGVQVVYGQPQHRSPALAVFAEQFDAEVVVLDPLAADWETNLRSIAKQLAAGFAAGE